MGQAARKVRAHELMDLLRLPRDYYANPVTACSGGERQRVALARALASDPEILFFDEPLSAIDYRLRKILEMEMKDLHRATGKTFIYITHCLEEAMVMSDRIAVMRDGKVVQLGDPLAIYRQPDTRFVAEFMGEVNLPPGAWSRGKWQLPELGQTLRTAPPGAAEGWIVLRPERLRFLHDGKPPDVTFSGALMNDYMLGSRSHVHIERDGRKYISEVPANARLPATGSDVALGFDLADAVVVTE